jgi:hypothetical protein
MWRGIISKSFLALLWRERIEVRAPHDFALTLALSQWEREKVVPSPW